MSIGSSDVSWILTVITDADYGLEIYDILTLSGVVLVSKCTCYPRQRSVSHSFTSLISSSDLDRVAVQNRAKT